MSIAMMLREGTAEKHQETEKVPYIRAIFRGGLDPQTYTLQLESLHFVYDSMENLFRTHKDHPILSKLYFPELFRADTLKEDLEFFKTKFGTKVRGTISPKTKSYMDHIEAAAKTNPMLLVAQAYVRYLGDLSGGQVIQKVLTKTFSLDEQEGTNFYKFPLINDLQAFKGIYRTALDTLPLNEEEKAALLEESKKVFDLNKDLFVELESDLRTNIGSEKFASLLPTG
jgi:heme oxygenase